MPIPIQNIYYLLCYAWNILAEEVDTELNGSAGDENVLNLLAYFFQRQNALLIKKGLWQQHIRQTQIINGLKGKLEINATLQAELFRQGKTVCSFETTSLNNLPNQIIKTTIRQLLAADKINAEWRAFLQFQLRTFAEVNTIEISEVDFDNARNLQKFNPYYKSVLAICELIQHNLLPESGEEKYYFKNFLEDERQMGRLFETFVRNFYQQEQQEFEVKSERIKWKLEDSEEASVVYLPQMLTDISLTSTTRNIILDTKFYKETLIQRYNKQKIISAHLYQLFAYLKNKEIKLNDQKTEGILLYPVVQQELDLKYQIQGHSISIKTINLAQPWQNIKQDLLAIIGA